MTKKEKVKKPFYKKWWVWLIAIIIVFAIASGGDDEPEVVESDDEEATTEASSDTEEEKEDKEEKEEEVEKKEKTEKKEKKKEDKKEEKDVAIGSGTYKVGEEIPAGEYVVMSSGMSYMEATKDSTGELESIIFNDNLMNGANSYITLNDGEYIKLQSAEMFPVDDAPSVKPEDGVYKDGMYKVGSDIPSGEYKVHLADDSVVGMGYIEVSNDSRHELGNIVSNDIVEADTYITVSDGQYLKLQDVYIEVD